MELTAAEQRPPFLQRARFDAERRGARRLAMLAMRRAQLAGARGLRPMRIGRPFAEAPLPRQGSLVSYTTVWVARPGLSRRRTCSVRRTSATARASSPMSEGWIEDVRVPTPVRAVISPDESAVPRFWLTPDGAGFAINAAGERQ